MSRNEVRRRRLTAQQRRYQHLDRLRRLGYSCECGPENMWCYHRRVREAQVAACLEVPPSYEFTCLGRGSACSARYAPPEI